MKEGPEQSGTKNAPKRSNFWTKAVTLISVATSAMALACASTDMSKKTTPGKRNEAGEVKRTVIKIKHRFAKFCGPEKEVNRYAEDICIKGTVKKSKEEGVKCVECEREIEVIE